jgi:CheY-like chemotaxis protein
VSNDARRPGDAPAGRILVVDADPEARAVACRALESAGWTVAQAEDAAGALAATTPDVILLDPALPGGGGEALIESAAAPVVVSTGFDGFERPALERGARQFLRKPADPRELVQSVRAAHRGQADPSIAADNRARTGRLRAESADARESLLAGTSWDPWLRDQLRALTAWAGGYFGVRRAFVFVLERGQLRVLAESGGAPLYPEGATTDPVVHFDSEVITAAAPLVVADAPAHAVFATHPAAAVASFYAGAPLRTAGRIALGTFCVEDVNPIAFHPEDAALLAALGRMAGRLLESIAHGGPPAPALFAVPGVFTAATLDALVTAELARATRGRSAMELALIALREPLTAALPDISHDVARVGRRRFALAVDEHRLAVVCGDVTRDLVRRRVEHAVNGFAWRHPVLAAGAASVDPNTRQTRPTAGADWSPLRLHTAALDMLELAGRSPAGPIQRIALA